MSISPITGYTSVFSAQRVTVDYEYEKIIKELLARGIAVSGDKAADKAKLQLVLAKEKTLIGPEQESFRPISQNPFSSIISELNLTATGDLKTDYDNIIKEIDNRISAASDDETKGRYDELKSETQYIYNERSKMSFMDASTTVSGLNRFLLGI